MAAAAGSLRLFGLSTTRRCSLTTLTTRNRVWSCFRPEYTGNDRYPRQPTILTCSRQLSTSFSNDQPKLADERRDNLSTQKTENNVRLSKLLSQHTKSLAISRREAERLIKSGDVTVAGEVITSPHFWINWDDLMGSIKAPGLIKVSGKGVALIPPSADGSTKSAHDNSTADRKIWIVHKLKGEIVADYDPDGRPSMMERLFRSGVGKEGKKRSHVKPVGRLDMMTEGLILVTTCGQYAREMELPSHQFHRTYKVRVHGQLTRHKMLSIKRGIRIDDKERGTVTRYGPMKVHMEAEKGHRRSATNNWIKITCTEGKNRQIRKVLQHLGLTVTRLIRVSFGDYQLQTIPPGMAVEVPIKDLNKQRHKGPLFPKTKKQSIEEKTAQRVRDGEEASPVQWVRHYR